MKKITKVLALAASLLALVFTGCNNPVDATVTGGSLGGKLHIFATSEDSYVKFPTAEELANARTITPEALNSSGLEFKLMAKNLISGKWVQDASTNEESTTKTEFPVSFVAYTDSTTEGYVDISLAVSNYELTLNAYDKTTKAQVLTAKAYADLRNNDTVRFYLLPISSGKGYVKLDLYTKGWNLQDIEYKAVTTAGSEAGYTVKAYITESLVSSSPINTSFTLTLANVDDTTTLPTAAAAPAKYNFPKVQNTQINSGTYNFVVEFTSVKDTSKVYYFSDRIVILPNQTTVASIGIPTGVIGKVPDAPDNLHVGYKTPATDDAGYYLAEFNWEDKSKNEAHFQLEMLDISDDAFLDTESTTLDAIKAVTAHGTTAGANWKTLSDNPKANHIVLDNTVYSKYDIDNTDYSNWDITYYEDTTNPSSLSLNSQRVGLNIPTGKRYLARLCAINAAGTSDYTYAIISDAAYTSFSYGTTSWPADAQEINIFKITYNLMGGNFYDASYDALHDTVIKLNNTTPVTSKIEDINNKHDKIIVYSSQSETGRTILNPLQVSYTDVAATKQAALYNGANKWSGWKLESSTNSKNFRSTAKVDATLPVYKFKLDAADNIEEYGFKDLDLYASYSSATAKIYNPADYTVTKDDVILYTSANGTFNTANVTAFASGDTIAIGDSYTYKKDDASTATKTFPTDYYGDGSGGPLPKKAPTFNAANNIYKKGTGTYTKQASEPGDWADNYNTDYCTITETAGAAPLTFAADTYYTKSSGTYTLVAADPTDMNTNYANYYTITETPIAGVDLIAGDYVQNKYYYKETNASANYYIYILVKNENKYSKVQLQLDQTNGTPIGTFNSANTQQTISVDVYTKLSTEPPTFDPTAYYKLSSGNYFPGITGENFAGTDWYAKSSENKKFDMFCIPTQSVVPTSFQATVKAYAGIATNTPYTYPIIFAITE